MYIGAKRLELNKWQFRLRIEKSPPWLMGFAPHVMFHFAKVIKRPPEGSVITKDCYKGIIWDYTIPTYRLTITYRTIQLAKLNFIYWVDIFYK